MGRRATGRFAGPLNTLSHLYRPGHVLLGRAQGWGFGLLQPVGMDVQRHLFMYAMSGAGKTVALVSILSTWSGSAFLVDPKAQITNALVKHDARRWFVLDPYGISNAQSASFNAFDCIREAVARQGPDAAVLWALRIAQALIVTPSAGAKQIGCLCHWPRHMSRSRIAICVAGGPFDMSTRRLHELKMA